MRFGDLDIIQSIYSYIGFIPIITNLKIIKTKYLTLLILIKA